MASSSVSAASVPPKKRKSSNASSDLDSETGRLLNALGSPGSSLADVGSGLVNSETATAPAAPLAITAKHHGKHDLEETHVHFPAELPHFHDHEEEIISHGGSKGSRNLPDRRLQPKKRKMSMESFGDLSSLDRRRKMSYESYDSAMGDSALGLACASMDSILPKLPDTASVNSKNSGASAQVNTHAPPHGVSALEHLDALGDDSADLPAPTSIHELKKAPSQELDKKPRARLKSDDFGEMKPPANKYYPTHHAETLVHPEDGEDGDDNASNETFTSSGHRLLMEAFMMSSGGGGLDSGGRKRLESWGGMSDLSFGDGHTAAAIAASALQHTGIIDDVTAAANFGAGSVDSSVTDGEYLMKPPAVAAAPGRDRIGSTTSFSDSTFPIPGSMDGMEISSDLQKFVAAAVASVGDQLAELAGAVESAALGMDVDSYSSRQLERPRLDSQTSSIETPIVVLPPGEDGSKYAAANQNEEHDAAKTVEAAATAAAISVDYDAVAAAVDAAQAATGALDLSAIGDSSFPSHHSSGNSVSSKTKVRRKLPVHSKKRGREDVPSFATRPDQLVSATDIHTMPPPKSTLSEAEQEAIRERARKAAGYVPPSEQNSLGANETPQRKHLPPFKKRKKLTPEPVRTLPHTTPKISNISRRPQDSVPSEVYSVSRASPSIAYSSYGGDAEPKSAVKGQSTQKWESMFECLLEFIEERKEEDLKGATQEEKDEWQWDGNVPTTHKTKDGKALGRWINNQRSAKSKGTLKEDREKRLVDAGLKWSVLASNSWNEMLDELREYVREYTKDGKKWDGNVPTNYRIKARANGKKLTEEDKNLGRWVNRQRSLYQAGKLRKDRQLALEKVGLKWSMLATTSWESMFETLVEYVEKKKKEEGKWDGNVPANYRTDDNPPRALGRWINRQRSAHVKKKLKPEYVEKLSQLGLKWSVHERRYSDDPRDCPTSIRPDNAPSSSANDNIPSTIAVPSRAVEKASVSEAFAAKSKESTSEENAPPNLDSDAKAEAAKPISAKMDPTSSTPVAAEQTPVKNSAVLAVETSKISSTLNSPAVEVPGSIFSCAKASVQTIKPVPGTTQEEIESASKAEGPCAATNVDKPVPRPNFPLKSSESEEKQQPGSVVNGSLATDTATVSEASRAINATLPAYNICESAQKGPSALEIGENDKHDVDGELKVEEQARKTPPISDEPTIGSNPNPTGLQTSSTKEASVLCKDPPPENSPGQADCNETSAAVVKEVQSDPKPDEPRQAESEKLAPGEGNQSIDADDAAPPKDVIKESEEAREGIIPAVETQDISSPPVVASEAHAPGATSGTMTDADTVEENALKTKEVEQEVPPAMQERTDTSESVTRSIVMTDDSSGARNEATGERSGTEMEKPVEPSSKSTGESNAEKCTEKYDKVEITKPNAREEDQNANVAETSTPEPSAAVENSNNSSSQVDLPTEKEDLERGHEEASNDTSTDDSDAVDNKSKIDSSVGVGAPEGDEKYSATPQPSNQCSPRATPEKSKSPQQAQPSTESRKRKGSESSGSEKAKGSKLKNSLKNLQIDMKIDQTKARGGRNARPTRSVSKKDCRQQC